MNTQHHDTRPLDPFETALLADLRAHVAARDPRPEPVPVPHRRPSHRWTGAVGAAAAAVAATVVVSGLGGGAGSPAYAVGVDDGAVVVTIHRLEDAAGLEAALAERGVDADVRYAGEQLQGVETGPAETEVRAEALPPATCDLGPAPTTLGRDGADWVLRIPPGSPLLEHPVTLDADARGVLDATWAATDGGTCSVLFLP